MAPQLHSLGKKLFLKHMLTDHGHKKPKCFLRSLLINKHFLNIARNRKIYKLSISPNSEEEINMYFESYTRHSGCYYGISTFEFVCCVLKLLKPPFTEFESYCVFVKREFSADILFTLMQLASANGKVSLSAYRYGEEDVSNVYEYVDELTCPFGLLPRADKVKFKLLDKLEVSDIESNEQLNAVLRHSAKRLELEFYLDYFDDERVPLHKNDAKQCNLKFRSEDNIAQSYPIIKNVLNACEKLEALDLCYYIDPENDITDFAMLLDRISQRYQAFKTFVEQVRQLSPNLVLNITSRCWHLWEETIIEFPKDWQQQIRQINGLESVEIEEETVKDEYVYVTISSETKSPLTNATFFFEIFD